MVKQILGVFTGYAIFVLSALVFFNISGENAHAEQAIPFMFLTGVWGLGFSFFGGVVCQVLARTGNLKVNFVLALIIASFAAFSFFKASGSHWSQLLAIFIFAPASVLGGWAYLKRKSN